MPAENDAQVILTPDQRLRVFISSTLREVADERIAAKAAVTKLRLAPVMFELGARPHPPRALYRSYLDQSHIFVGIYWQSYGWVAPDEEISGLEDEYRLSGNRPKLIYVKSPSPDREPRLKELLHRIQTDDRVAYNTFSTPAQLQELIENDLALLLTEQFEKSQHSAQPNFAKPTNAEDAAPLADIPAAMTSLIGREDDVTQVGNLLRRKDIRLVTLLGPGGIGKTRLSLQVAASLKPEFHDGVCVVDLSSIRETALVAPTIARALGLREGSLAATDKPVQSAQERLRAHLHERHMLLVLDNFEQVLPAAPLVADLLASAPGLSVLTTSRELLRLRGEHEFAVQPLSLPQVESGAHPSKQAIENCAAVRLFVERAQAAHSSFELTDENAPFVAEICLRLDGLPLAIELAAARTRLLPPKAMLSKLEGVASLRFLTGGARDLPERQQTLRGAVAWSYALLNAEEQRLFQRLSVFVGGCTLEAAEAICGDADVTEVMDVLSSLVDKSLVVQTAHDADSGPRFAMLSVIRDYAYEQLEASGGAGAIRQKLADFYCATTKAAAPNLRSARQSEVLAAMEADIGNLRAALSHLIETNQLRAAAEMASTPWLFWLINGHIAEGLRWLNEIAARLDAAGVADLSVMPLRAVLAGPIGGLMVWSGDYEHAVPILEQARDLYRAAGIRNGLASTLVALAITAINQQAWDQATHYVEEGLSINRELDDNWGVAVALNVSGWLATRQGNYAKSAEIYKESLARSRRVGDKLNESFAWLDLGWAELLQKNLASARTMFHTCLDLAHQLQYKIGVAYAAEGLACVAIEEGKTEGGVALFGAANVLREQVGAPIWRIDRSVHDQLLAGARVTLGSPAFDAALAAGRGTPIEVALVSGTTSL